MGTLQWAEIHNDSNVWSTAQRLQKINWFNVDVPFELSNRSVGQQVLSTIKIRVRNGGWKDREGGGGRVEHGRYASSIKSIQILSALGEEWSYNVIDLSVLGQGDHIMSSTYQYCGQGDHILWSTYQYCGQGDHILWSTYQYCGQGDHIMWSTYQYWGRVIIYCDRLISIVGRVIIYCDRLISIEAGWSYNVIDISVLRQGDHILWSTYQYCGQGDHILWSTYQYWGRVII